MHVPVLAEEALQWLNVRPGRCYVDCTAGAGGHAQRIWDALDGDGRLMCIDRDPLAIGLLHGRFDGFERLTIHHAPYRDVKAVVESTGVDGVDGVLLDAGVSSMQLDDPKRGFTFQASGPLDMRMDPTAGITAEALLAGIREDDLASVLKEYGDVPHARGIARAICARRDRGGLSTTRDLADAVGEAFPHLAHDPDEVRTVFQAIRIAVNDELRQLDTTLRDAVALLRPEGRLVVITFHSGEDRIAKNVMRELSKPARERYADGRTKSVTAPVLKLLTPKPVTPGEEERRANPRSASAKLRAAQKLPA